MVSPGDTNWKVRPLLFSPLPFSLERPLRASPARLPRHPLYMSEHRDLVGQDHHMLWLIGGGQAMHTLCSHESLQHIWIGTARCSSLELQPGRHQEVWVAELWQRMWGVQGRALNSAPWRGREASHSNSKMRRSPLRSSSMRRRRSQEQRGDLASESS